jgi:hypothetical protein
MPPGGSPLPALASAPGLTPNLEQPRRPGTHGNLAAADSALPGPAGMKRLRSNHLVREIPAPHWPAAARWSPADPHLAHPYPLPGPGRSGQQPRFECPKRGSGRQIVSKDNFISTRTVGPPASRSAPRRPTRAAREAALRRGHGRVAKAVRQPSVRRPGADPGEPPPTTPAASCLTATSTGSPQRSPNRRPTRNGAPPPLAGPGPGQTGATSSCIPIHDLTAVEYALLPHTTCRFEEEATRMLMAALLVHDLHTAGPGHAHPWQDEAYAVPTAGCGAACWARRATRLRRSVVLNEFCTARRHCRSAPPQHEDDKHDDYD